QMQGRFRGEGIREPRAMSSNFETLKREILARSVAKDWTSAKDEWSFAYQGEAEDADAECLCTYYPIRELFFILNRITGEEVQVGSKCIDHFVSPAVSRAMSNLEAVRSGKAKSPNPDLIAVALANGRITEWEARFLIDTFRKRRLSEKQK